MLCVDNLPVQFIEGNLCGHASEWVFINTNSEYIEGEDDIVIKFKLKDITQQLLSNFLVNLQHIIHESVDEPGAFEYGPFIVVVNRKVDRASEKMVVSNPTIKPEHMYSIH